MTQTTSQPSDSQKAAQRLTESLSPSAIDSLIKDAKSSGTPLDGVDGLLNQLTKAVLGHFFAAFRAIFLAARWTGDFAAFEGPPGLTGLVMKPVR